MPNGHVLELATLPARHPLIGDALLRQFAGSVIFRLSIYPTPQPPAMIKRTVTVHRIARPGTKPAIQEDCDIGWSGLPSYNRDYCVRLSRTVNEHDVTEQAAIGVMALLIHELEGGVLQQVLPIGSGGDYLVLPRGARHPIQVEVSGIREDRNGSASQSRLRQKCDQVLTASKAGYASVTTFSHPAGPIVQSWLHYVEKGRKMRSGGKRKHK